MQQFVVPQFIEVEDKIFGPVTTRQFLIILTAAILVFLAFRFGDFSLFVTALILIGGGALVLAFVKVNGQVFHYFILNIVQTMQKPSLRVWNKNYSEADLNFYRAQTTAAIVASETAQAPAKKERIRDLALLVNTGGFYRPGDSV